MLKFQLLKFLRLVFKGHSHESSTAEEVRDVEELTSEHDTRNISI